MLKDALPLTVVKSGEYSTSSHNMASHKYGSQPEQYFMKPQFNHQSLVT